MHVMVVGPGGVGGPVAVDLARSGVEVSVVARAATATAISEGGLRVLGARGERAARVRVAVDAAALPPADVVVLTPKLYDLDEALRTLGSQAAAGAVFVPLQNGVDAPGMVARALPGARVAPGIALVNAGMERPGVVRQHSDTQRIEFGSRDPADAPVLDAFARACRAAGFEGNLVLEPDAALWEKAIGLMAASGMTALTRRSIGEVRSNPRTRAMMEGLARETAAVGRAAGVGIAEDVVRRRMAYLDGMPHGANSSMAKDLLAGRRLELPWLHGRLSEIGRELGVPTPLSDFVVGALELHVAGQPLTKAA